MKVHPVGKRLSEVERAYIAGFLDADGAIMASIERHPEKKFGYRIRVILKATQAQNKILYWLLKKCQCGLVRKNRTTHDWIVRDQIQVGEMLNTLFPYFRVKKRQALKAIKLLSVKAEDFKSFKKQARLADSLALLNVRSKGRRKNSARMIQDNRSRND